MPNIESMEKINTHTTKNTTKNTLRFCLFITPPFAADEVYTTLKKKGDPKVAFLQSFALAEATAYSIIVVRRPCRRPIDVHVQLRFSKKPRPNAHQMQAS